MAWACGFCSDYRVCAFSNLVREDYWEYNSEKEYLQRQKSEDLHRDH